MVALAAAHAAGGAACEQTLSRPPSGARRRVRHVVRAQRLVEFARNRQAVGADASVVQHIQDHETARHLVEECRDIFGSEPAFVSEVGPVLGAHAGPGMIGVGGVSSSLLRSSG